MDAVDMAVINTGVFLLKPPIEGIPSGVVGVDSVVRIARMLTIGFSIRGGGIRRLFGTRPVHRVAGMKPVAVFPCGDGCKLRLQL